MDSLLVRCGPLPVLVDFRDAGQSYEKEVLSNGTGIELGQIPELHFQLASDVGDAEIQILTTYLP